MKKQVDQGHDEIRRYKYRICQRCKNSLEDCECGGEFSIMGYQTVVVFEFPSGEVGIPIGKYASKVTEA